MDNSVTKKRAQSNEIDMLNGPLFKKILLFALPLGGSSGPLRRKQGPGSRGK